MKPTALLALVTRALERFDFLCAAAWWWRWQRQRAEGQLECVLRAHGELSFETSRATDRVAQMDFASDFWRDAPGAVRRVVQAASRNGVPEDALRLAVLNRDLSLRGGKVYVRRSRILRALAFVTGCLVGFHWLLMMALTIAQSGPASLKVAVAILVTLTYLLMHRAWSLYLGRPCKVMARWGDELQRIADALTPAPVVGSRFGRP